MSASSMARLAALVLLCALFFSQGPAVAGVSKEVKFAPGTSGTVIEGAVIRGERDRYWLKARAGQRMTVLIESLEDNAVFMVMTPQKGLLSDPEATSFNGRLPSSGTYMIEVGGTRGNASYTLTIKIQ